MSGKLCLSCMKKIPLMAGRCPYCRDENQGVYGRFILLVLLLVAIVVFSNWYIGDDNKVVVPMQQNNIQEIEQGVETEDVDEELLKEFKAMSL